MKAPRRLTVEQDQDQPPLDIETLRAAASRLLAEDAEAPTPEELETLTVQLRGHIGQLVPEVEQAAGRLPYDDIPRYCALACVGEARHKVDLSLKLDLKRSGLDAGVAHARRLSRVVNALCDHLENLGGGHA
ncbi:DUF6415 family natural product biosynthesis protein [Streptomyces xiangluensis]|uniref:DUF6415 family natural product biosynthesis protein n=1 Tax=Streptomyces xiangluensis TaxID=2665720 RepID=A0ABV8YN22_9ACTN